MEDKILIFEYLNAKNSNAIDTLLSRYQNYIFSICMKYSDNLEEAKDNLQEILIKVFDKIHTYTFEAKFSTWLYSISRNHCFDEKKRRQRNIYKLNEYLKHIEYFDEINLDDQDTINLKTLLKNLEQKDQDILVLKYLKKKSIAEISNESGLSQSCIKMRISRAKTKARTNMIN